MSVEVYSLPGHIEGERNAFFLRGARRGVTLWDYPKEHLVVIRDEKVSPFVKFEIILPFLCFLVDSLTNKHCITWSSTTNLWIDSRTSQKWRILLSARQSSSIYPEPSKENVLWEYWPCFTWNFFMIWLHKIVKLIFQKQPSCSRNKCTEHWRKLPNLIAFCEIFWYLKNNDSVEHV